MGRAGEQWMSVLVQDPTWMARVEEMAKRGEEIAAQMNSPEAASSGALMVKLAKEYGELEKVLKPFREYREVTTHLSEMQGILDDPAGDADLQEIAQAEVPELT